ncbi:hypothetical protein T484DRAFT_1940102 [Baffinella frigidus]|nr:hypothetical protein T484DRAFT_1940102 [Cryptophyta sp. CCMP2293]
MSEVPLYWCLLASAGTTPAYLLGESCAADHVWFRGLTCLLCSPFYGRACRWAMLGEIKT